MKRLILFGFAVVLAAAIAAPPARAITTFDPGCYQGSINDRSSIFRDGVPTEPGTVPAVGDEQRNLFVLDAVDFGFLTNGDPPGTKFIDNISGAPYTNGQLTGLIYDAIISGFSDETGDGIGDPPDGVTTSDIYKVPGTRYTDALGPDGIANSGDEGSQGIWTDTVPGVGGLLASSAAGYGAIVVIYDDNALNSRFWGDDPLTAEPDAGDGDGLFGVSAGDGDDDWRVPGDVSGTSPHPGAGVMAVPGVLTNADYFPTFSDVAGSNVGVSDSGTAIPWLVAVIAPLPLPFSVFEGVPPGTILWEDDFDILAGAVGGTAFLNIIGGAAASHFATDVFGPGLDIRIDFELDVPTVLVDPNGIPFDGDEFVQQVVSDDGWLVTSDDPAQWCGVAIPEPATLGLLGLALTGLAGLRRRRTR